MAANDREKKFEERHAEELGAKRYAYKQLKQWVINLGAPIAGAIGGLGLGALKKGEPWAEGELLVKTVGAEKLPLMGNMTKAKAVMAGAGLLAGAIVAGIVELYEHWRQVEGARIAAAEVNDDVSNMKIRMRTDPELLRENDRLRQMLEAEEKKSAARVAEVRPAAARPEARPAAEVPTTHLHADGREHDSRVIDASSRAIG